MDRSHNALQKFGTYKMVKTIFKFSLITSRNMLTQMWQEFEEHLKLYYIIKYAPDSLNNNKNL